MNYDLSESRSSWIALLGLTTACVLSEPIGETPSDSTTTAADTDPAPSTTRGSTTDADSPSSGVSASGVEDPDGSTTGVPFGDTEASTGNSGRDNDGRPACDGALEDNFSWQWSFGAYEPQIDDEDLTYDADATVALECDVLGFDADGQRDELTLELDCEAGGIPIPPQQLSLSPIAEDLTDELQAPGTYSVFFRPEQECPNGCSIGDNGWLSIRRAVDNELIVGIVDVHHLLAPVDELAPITVTTTNSDCSRVFDRDSTCPTPGWIDALDVVVEFAGDSATVTGSGRDGVLNHWVLVNRALRGAYDECTADGGDRAEIQLMVMRALAIK